jgi:phage tail-like protein
MKSLKHCAIVLAISGVMLAVLALIDGGQFPIGRAAAQPVSVAGAESYVFVLELQGQQAGEYIECSGLGSHNEVEEQTTVTAGGGVVVGETPGALQWHRITLKASAPGNAVVWQWRKTMETTGLATARRDGRVSLYQAGSSQPLAQWSFQKGWPASLNFDGTNEELVIVHEGLTLGGSTGGGTPSRS